MFEGLLKEEETTVLCFTMLKNLRLVFSLLILTYAWNIEARTQGFVVTYGQTPSPALRFLLVITLQAH